MHFALCVWHAIFQNSDEDFGGKELFSGKTRKVRQWKGHPCEDIQALVAHLLQRSIDYRSSLRSRRGNSAVGSAPVATVRACPVAVRPSAAPMQPTTYGMRPEACVPASGWWTERFICAHKGRMDSQAIKVPRRNKFPEQALREKHVVPVPLYSVKVRVSVPRARCCRTESVCPLYSPVARVPASV